MARGFGYTVLHECIVRLSPVFEQLRIPCSSPDILALISYRIAAHRSIDVFSRKVGVSARQIARCETENYQNTNSSTLRKIPGVLDIHLNDKIT